MGPARAPIFARFGDGFIVRTGTLSASAQTRAGVGCASNEAANMELVQHGRPRQRPAVHGRFRTQSEGPQPGTLSNPLLLQRMLQIDAG